MHCYISSINFHSGCMDDLRLYVLFDSILVISVQREGNIERLCAIAPVYRLLLKLTFTLDLQKLEFLFSK